MNALPAPGRVDCTRCFSGCSTINFDQTRREEGDWRITANPLAWGNESPEVIVLGFSKGPTQAGALSTTPHNEIAYKGGRGNVGIILSHVGLLPAAGEADLTQTVTKAIANPSGRFHFASLVRCTVELYDQKTSKWKGSGGRMLDKFVQSSFGNEVATNCTEEFLSELPGETKLIVMFGLGSSLNYVNESFKLYEKARKGSWRWLNEIAYTDGSVVVVHVEHFASQGALIPQWMGQDQHKRGKYGRMAQEAVKHALGETAYPVISPPHTIQVTQIEKPRSTAESKKTAIEKEKEAPKNEADVITILEAFVNAGYTETKNIDKVAGFKAPGGHVVYLVKTTSTLTKICLMVHPDFSPEILSKLDGVDSVGSEHNFHSNMSGFPKRINKGKTPTAYGWQLMLNSLPALAKFLATFSEARI